ncbi:MAG TPA: hypothetical protein VEG08_04390 [Terriglobales bacterium]|nr:hypothetical protein [Terriglobales bacterium]
MAREYRTGDCVLAMTTGPDLVLSLTCNLAQRWQVTVFDSAKKKATLTDHEEPTLEAAKRFATGFVASQYGVDVGGATWKEVLKVRPSGPSG